MTATDFTYLAIVADRSGSMISIQDDAEGGVKTLIAEQRKLPGKLTINLFQFDDVFDEVADTDLDTWSLIPRGSTALLDAIGKSMTMVGERLAAMPEDERPDRVIFAIVTDGRENASREWRRDKILALTTQQQDKYGWQLIFTAANLDAHAEAASLGIANSMNFAANPENTRDAYSAMSAGISDYRKGVSTRTAVPDHA